MPIQLSGIWIYPVKSLRAIKCESAEVRQRGLEFDRRWMVVDENGRFISQREVPGLAAITVTATDDVLLLSSAVAGELSLPNTDRGNLIEVEIWNDRVSAHDLGRGAAEWISKATGKSCSLVRLPQEVERYTSIGNSPVSFADGYPLLLISEASLEELNQRLKNPVPMNRFRPNITVNGTRPFAEDSWKAIRIGDAEFEVVKPCARCVVTTVDQEGGVVSGNEPLRTLSEFRRASEVYPENYGDFGLSAGGVLFGQNLIPQGVRSRIKQGDKVEVIETL
ncbi:MAG: MOSC domain-containing protein [Acidobacteria bacterium]|nr:MAG: MOSC domain-containing protein [Acidobacteriota bacterium]REK01142.1 MAG: MOSC domain-containing protein [Acidobacteriota bacterium]REK14098.1 MAG: MOSC domain-containing protein [Acidobacteriota bacterium]REK44813.1 MAG: MOSC domain-containing protein [Acidobacteriota bacterium]